MELCGVQGERVDGLVGLDLDPDGAGEGGVAERRAEPDVVANGTHGGRQAVGVVSRSHTVTVSTQVAWPTVSASRRLVERLTSLAAQRTRFDVVGVGNALVDVIAHADDRFLHEYELVKGAMTLVRPIARSSCTTPSPVRWR